MDFPKSLQYFDIDNNDENENNLNIAFFLLLFHSHFQYLKINKNIFIIYTISFIIFKNLKLCCSEIIISTIFIRST